MPIFDGDDDYEREGEENEEEDEGDSSEAGPSSTDVDMYMDDDVFVAKGAPCLFTSLPSTYALS